MKAVAPFVCALCLLSLSTPAQAAENKRVLVYEVHEVTVRVMESYPQQLSITARGTTRTGGWSDPLLRPVSQPASNGIYQFTFLARPPQGAATMAITPVVATRTMQMPPDFRAVRVLAETNSKEAK